jgi:YD repeat-containing protein
MLTAKDPLADTTTFVYSGADLASVTDPLGRKTTYAHDAIGRVILKMAVGAFNSAENHGISWG